MMRYYVRVGIGMVLGLALVGLLAWLGVRTWVVATSGALAGVVAFLATFFLWTADRPEEGYEQVLFDRRNNVHGLLVAGLLVGASFGAGWMLGAGAPALDPAEAEAAAALAQQRDALQALADPLQSMALQTRSLGEPPEGFEATLAQQREALARAREALEAVAVSERLAPMKDALSWGAGFLAEALDNLALCGAGQPQACLDAVNLVGEWQKRAQAFQDEGVRLGVPESA